ncbi:DUF2834 domain-containing protein [Hyphomonas adhaerens]|mgnify:FL=1|uniref:DUF2834 domain-containing protein n=1 Tax=Hyphomonas adhaerens TaxID=81029 RepID=UPI0023538C7F|nr:DUF2834 domain-containing protein [Hyphomonas adhaerens]|tara:strand:- start:301 stop:624 length:324 start_codon:yes stop_codon:yes gene_type:complete
MKPAVLVYALLAIAGAVLPLSQFLPWFMEHGLDVPRFVGDLFATRIGGFFGWDVIVSAVVLTVFILIEGRRIGLRYLWLPIACTFSVGVSFGLPVFLAMRERTLRAD